MRDGISTHPPEEVDKIGIAVALVFLVIVGMFAGDQRYDQKDINKTPQSILKPE